MSNPSPEQLRAVAAMLDEGITFATWGAWEEVVKQLPPPWSRVANQAGNSADLFLCRAVALCLKLEAVRLEQAAFSNVSSAERGYEDRQIAGVVRASWEKQTEIVPPTPVADARRE